jgi:hypothetical protein
MYYARQNKIDIFVNICSCYGHFMDRAAYSCDIVESQELGKQEAAYDEQTDEKTTLYEIAPHLLMPSVYGSYPLTNPWPKGPQTTGDIQCDG